MSDPNTPPADLPTDRLAEWEAARQSVLALEASIADLDGQFRQLQARFTEEIAPYKEAVVEAQDRLSAAQRDLKQRAADFEAEMGGVRDRLKADGERLQAQRKRLKELATAAVQPWRAPSGVRYQPPTRDFGGVALRRTPRLKMPDEQAAAAALQGVVYEPAANPRGMRRPAAVPLVEVVYRVNRQALLAWLKQNPDRAIPGVVELTEPDDPSHYAMTVRRDRKDEEGP